MAVVFAAAVSLGAVSCTKRDPAPGRSPPRPSDPAPSHVIAHVFVIPMENSDAASIYGNASEAPYINGVLLPRYAHATQFVDELPLAIPSEPHYIWLEAGTNAFRDRTFDDDEDPSAANATADTQHLTTQIRDATSGVTWRAYQEGIGRDTGACPIHMSDDGLYAPKHDPFVFFKDVSGDPPSADNAYCASHHRPYSAFAADLAAGDVATYTFITPHQCHDMHGARACMDADFLRLGDDWLAAELPRIIEYANGHAGVVFLLWDEGRASGRIPFFAIGPGVKRGYASHVRFTHGSVLKSIEAILGLSTNPRVVGENDLADLFEPGQYP